MNDEFLYRLRAEPPPAFAARLRSRLERQSSGSVTRSRVIRTFIAVSLMGASAFAVMSPTVRDKASAFVQSLRGEEETPAHAASGSAPQSATAPSDVPAAAVPSSSAYPAETPFGHSTTSGKGPSAASGSRPATSPSAPVPQTSSAAGARVSAGRRDRISVIGSPIVYPFTRAVADKVRGSLRSASVAIESTADTSEAFEQFCKGSLRVEILQAARRIGTREVEACGDKYGEQLFEVKVGHYALVPVSGLGAVPMQLTRRDLYRALARRVQDPLNPRRSVANPNRTWQDVNSTLPALNIQVLGPPLALEAGDALAEMLLAPWCGSDVAMRLIKGVDKQGYTEMCGEIRSDGAYQATGATNTALLARLDANPNLLAIVEYRHLAAWRDRVVEVPFEGVSATRETIASGGYPGARPLYLYIRGSSLRSHLDLDDFAFEYLSDSAIGPRGYLVNLGLVPLEEAERRRIQASPFGATVLQQ